MKLRKAIKYAALYAILIYAVAYLKWNMNLDTFWMRICIYAVMIWPFIVMRHTGKFQFAIPGTDGEAEHTPPESPLVMIEKDSMRGSKRRKHGSLALLREAQKAGKPRCSNEDKSPCIPPPPQKKHNNSPTKESRQVPPPIEASQPTEEVAPYTEDVTSEAHDYWQSKRDRRPDHLSGQTLPLFTEEEMILTDHQGKIDPFL